MRKPRPRNVHTTGYKRFLEQLKQARREAELDQADVAKRLKRPQSYVSKCESGERRVDIIELAAYARIYKKSLSYFVKL